MKILTMEQSRYAEVASMSIISHLQSLPREEQHKWLEKEINHIIEDVKEALTSQTNLV